MSPTRKLLAVVAGFAFVGAVFLLSGCELAEVLASGYMPLGYYNSNNYTGLVPGFVPFAAAPNISRFNAPSTTSGVRPSVNTMPPTFNTMSGGTSTTGTIPNTGTGSGTTVNNNTIPSNTNTSTGTVTNIVPSTPTMPTVQGGTNTMPSGLTVGQAMESLSAGY